METKDKIALLGSLITERGVEARLIWQRINIFVVIQIAVHSFIFGSAWDVLLQANSRKYERFVDSPIFPLSLLIALNVIYAAVWIRINYNGAIYYRALADAIEGFEIEVGATNPFKSIREDTRSERKSLRTLILVSMFMWMFFTFDLVLLAYLYYRHSCP